MSSIPTLILAGTVLFGAGGLSWMEAGLAPAANAAGTGAGGKSKPAPLKAVEFEEAERVPYEIEVAIGAEGPEAAWLRTQQPLVDLLSAVRLEQRKKELWIHFPERPRPVKVKGGKKPVLVEFPPAWLSPDSDGDATPLLFYSKQGQWFAAPAAMMTAKTKAGLLELLDVDLDGVFGSEDDYLAWRGGRFRYCGTTPQVHAENGLLQVELTDYRKKPALELKVVEGPESNPSALPPLLAADIQTAWLRTNELRNQVGLEPVALDLERIDAAIKHSKYLQLNAPSRTTSHINVHDEIEGKPGFTPEGRQAAGGNVKWVSSGAKLGAQPDYEFATLFHRSELIYPSQTMGAGADGGYSVVWIERGQADNARWLRQNNLSNRWVMVPGPGQSNVPRRARRDSPTPASVPDFYQRERGWPISVATSYQYGQLTDVSLRLFDAKGNEVGGYPITMGDAGFGDPGFQAHYLFAADAPLAAQSRYRAEFSAKLKDGGRQLHYSWVFETSK